MKKRVKEAQIEAKRRGENETVNKEYFYPKKLFRDILREYKNKTLGIEEPDTTLLELEKYKESIQGDQSALPGQEETTQLADIQTPPLPNMAMPVVQTARANVNPNTNLTRSQEALLSPEEKIIASRRV
jgi:hypothetical protein